MSGNAPLKTFLMALRPKPLVIWMPFRSSNMRPFVQPTFPGTCTRVFPRPHSFRTPPSVPSSSSSPTRFIHLSSSKAFNSRPPPPDEKFSEPTSSHSDLKSEYSSPSERAYSAQDETPEDRYKRRNDSAAPQPFSPPAADSGGSSLPIFPPITRSPTFDAALTTVVGLVIGEHPNALCLLMPSNAQSSGPQCSSPGLLISLGIRLAFSTKYVCVAFKNQIHLV